jgi:hypothetical protein
LAKPTGGWPGNWVGGSKSDGRSNCATPNTEPAPGVMRSRGTQGAWAGVTAGARACGRAGAGLAVGPGCRGLTSKWACAEGRSWGPS